jgi:phenylacetate-coenzyme A ligase PaaK-like adenylate-forming protein
MNSLVLQAEGILKYHTFLKRSQWWPREKMEKWQERAKQRIEDIAEKMPFYNIPKEVREECQYWGTPFVCTDKASIRRSQPYQFDFPKGTIHRTSGSTGESLSVVVSHRAEMMEHGFVHRHWSWVGYKFRDPVIHLRSYVPEKGEPLFKRDGKRNHLYLSAYHLNPDNVDIYLTWIEQFKPVIVRGYPSSLYLLSQTARLPYHTPRAVITSGETMSPEMRKAIQNYWGCVVMDWYGQAEITANICQCPEGSYHVSEEYGLVEIIKGEIIATNFWNTAQPLIRYKTGDMAEWGEPCKCGRESRTIKALSGRKDDMILTDFGYYVPSVNLYTLFKDFSSWQLERNKDGVLLRFNRFPTIPEMDYIRSGIRQRLGEVKISWDPYGHFTINKDGKKRAIINGA